MVFWRLAVCHRSEDVGICRVLARCSAGDGREAHRSGVYLNVRGRKETSTDVICGFVPCKRRRKPSFRYRKKGDIVPGHALPFYLGFPYARRPLEPLNAADFGANVTSRVVLTMMSNTGCEYHFALLGDQSWLSLLRLAILEVISALRYSPLHPFSSLVSDSKMLFPAVSCH